MASTLNLEVDIQSLNVGDLIELENATKAGEIVAWCVAHTNASATQLRALPLSEFMPLAAQLAEQVKNALTPPK